MSNEQPKIHIVTSEDGDWVRVVAEYSISPRPWSDRFELLWDSHSIDYGGFITIMEKLNYTVTQRTAEMVEDENGFEDSPELHLPINPEDYQ